MLLVHETERFSTVALLRLGHSSTGWSVVMAMGGHPLPLHVRGAVPRHVGAAGSLIGVLDEVDVHDVEFALEPGDMLVVHTDGVTEARRRGEFYGEQRLRDSATTLSAETNPAEALLAEVLAFQGGRPRDDIAIVTLRVPA